MAARSRIALASLFLFLVSTFLLFPILPMAHAQTSQPSGGLSRKGRKRDPKSLDADTASSLSSQRPRQVHFSRSLQY